MTAVLYGVEYVFKASVRRSSNRGGSGYSVGLTGLIYFYLPATRTVAFGKIELDGEFQCNVHLVFGAHGN